MTVAELTPYLKEHWPAIRARLLDGTYRPQPVRRVEIPGRVGANAPSASQPAPAKAGVLDRFVQQAVLQVLQGAWDGTFSASSYGVSAGPLGASGGGAGARTHCGGPALGGGHRPRLREGRLRRSSLTGSTTTC
jgi:hypothetical protein